MRLVALDSDGKPRTELGTVVLTGDRVTFTGGQVTEDVFRSLARHVPGADDAAAFRTIAGTGWSNGHLSLVSDTSS